MNQKIKYIYFEKHFISGKDATTPHLKNQNALLLQPQTNSSGIHSFINITERKYEPNKHKSDKSYAVVEQYWIDLEKYDSSNKKPTTLDKMIQETLNKLNRLINREDLFDELLNKNNS